jgi:ParB-like chromosome segregation protein Spo0J
MVRQGRRGKERLRVARHGKARQAFKLKEKEMEQERKLLTKMALQNGGVLKVEDVLQEAQDEGSILHRHFEWDDTEAAVQYRKQQARTLIARCRITLVETEPVQIRAFVSLPTDREAGGGYRLTSEVVSDAALKAELLRDIQLTIVRWTQKMHLLDGDLADAILDFESRVAPRVVQQEKRA